MSVEMRLTRVCWLSHGRFKFKEAFKG